LIGRAVAVLLTVIGAILFASEIVIIRDGASISGAGVGPYAGRPFPTRRKTKKAKPKARKKKAKPKKKTWGWGKW